MGVIYFNGISSEKYGVLVEHPPGYSYPEKEIEFVHIEGRNGDLTIDKGSYQNVTRSYDLAVGDESVKFSKLANNLSSWLHSSRGYARLEDTYEPDYFRMAIYSEGNDIENILQHAGRVTVEFNCKPQRFLKSGDIPLRITNNKSLFNPTNFESNPLIVVNGSGNGTIKIGDYTITVNGITSGMCIDSELMDVYKGSTNLNSKVVLPNSFPRLVKGENTIQFSGGVTSLEVTPRWWTL